jgi:hypothetical protein
MKVIYIVWFRDPNLSPDDQDYEWPACFIIDAPCVDQAASWGDHLASKYARSRGQQMLSSSVELLEIATLPGKEELPEITYGLEATDDEIGW